MDSLVLAGSSKTPNIHLDAESGVLTFEGRSIPENSLDFYKPVIEWLDQYIASPMETTEVVMKLEYFNTSSSKCILDVFKKLEVVYKRGKKVMVHWHYEVDDEDMLEAGEDYQSILKIPFTMVEFEE